VTRDADGSGRTRRTVLSASAAAALVGLTGCGGRISDRFTGGPRTIDGEALIEATRGEVPTVSETLPVDIEDSFVGSQRDLARSKLDATPAPFDEATIPNGVIRERLNDEYDGALRSIRDASKGPTPYERLGHATHARTAAHEVAAAWGAIESKLTTDDLRASIPAVRGDVDALDSRWSPVGDDPVRAAIVHREIERGLRGARRWLSIPDGQLRAAGQPLELADVAVDIERTRTDTAVGSYLFDRFRGRLDEPTDLTDRLVAARGDLRRRIDRRAEPLPPDGVDDPTSLVDRDVGTTAGVRALAELASDTRRRIEDVATDNDDPRLASDVLSATTTLAHLRAFEHLRDRIEGGDDVAVASAADVGALRSEATEAIAAAKDADRAELLIDALLPGLAGNIGWIDDQFDRGSGGVRVESVAFDAMRYVTVAALCGALPETAAEAVAVLRGSE
jgi:hypothetical protein